MKERLLYLLVLKSETRVPTLFRNLGQCSTNRLCQFFFFNHCLCPRRINLTGEVKRVRRHIRYPI